MAKSSSIVSLPKDILDTLVHQYLHKPSWTLDDHVAWLAGVGYEVSRSSLHRYLFNRKETMLQAKAEKDMAIAAEMATRERCLQIAAGFYKGGDLNELIGIAEELLDWIQRVDTASVPTESFFRE